MVEACVISVFYMLCCSVTRKSVGPWCWADSFCSVFQGGVLNDVSLGATCCGAGSALRVFTHMCWHAHCLLGSRPCSSRWCVFRTPLEVRGRYTQPRWHAHCSHTVIYWDHLYTDKLMYIHKNSQRSKDNNNFGKLGTWKDWLLVQKH